MRKIIKWGVIGSGGIAQRRTIPEGIVAAQHAELSVVYDINQEVNQAVARTYGATAVDSIAELLSSDIDAVYIASPINKHFEQVVAAAKAKKHILCEKSLGMSVAEVELMISVCKTTGVTFGVAFMMRFMAQHQAALKMIQDGKLGKPVFGRAQLSCWYPPIQGAWRQDPAQGGGGSLLDMGSHCIDLMEMFFGKIRKVHCFVNRTVHPYKAEDSAVVSLFFENGAMATVDAFFCIPDNSSKNILELYGSKGSILARSTIGQSPSGEMIAYLEDDNAVYNAQQSRTAGEGIQINPEPVNPYMAEVEEFSCALLEGREPSNSAAIGLQSQIIMDACYLSAETGETVELK